MYPKVFYHSLPLKPKSMLPLKDYEEIDTQVVSDIHIHWNWCNCIFVSYVDNWNLSRECQRWRERKIWVSEKLGNKWVFFFLLKGVAIMSPEAQEFSWE